jgi:RNA polymerase sigma-70 factor (ECF subfamily)
VPNPESESPRAAPLNLARWFAAEVHPHEPALRGYLRGSFPAVRDVDDVVQESFLRIWRARAAQPITSARAFLFQIARRLAFDAVRRERHDFVGDVRDFPANGVLLSEPESTDAAANLERVRLLTDAIEALPARCREVFIMRKLQALSQRETAARLGLSERTVEVQVARAMRRCEAYLRNHGLNGLSDDAA